MVEIAPTSGIQLELPIPEIDSVVLTTTESQKRRFTTESQNSEDVDSVVNSQLLDDQYQRLISYLTKKNTTQRKYGSGWISSSKSGGSARTDNQYLKYWYRVHWRETPYQVYLGSAKNDGVLEVAKNVREAIDTNQPPSKIVAMIKAAKNQCN